MAFTPRRTERTSTTFARRGMRRGDNESINSISPFVVMKEEIQSEFKDHFHRSA
jgi:hypothetical protein